MNKAWLAGFIDGEGCIQFGKQKRGIFPRILIVHTNKEILEEIRNIYTGDIQSKRTKEHWKTSHFYRLAWTKAIELLRDVYPYLKLKKQNADIIFEWEKVRTHRKCLTKENREKYEAFCMELSEKMKMLNKKGS